jgi:hypothetical protein
MRNPDDLEWGVRTATAEAQRAFSLLEDALRNMVRDWTLFMMIPTTRLLEGTVNFTIGTRPPKLIENSGNFLKRRFPSFLTDELELFFAKLKI